MPTKNYRKFVVICKNGDLIPMAVRCADLGLSYDTVLARINRLPVPFVPNPGGAVYIHASHEIFGKVKR